MKKYMYVFLACIMLVLSSCSKKPLTFETDHLKIGIDSTGNIISLMDKSSGIEYISENQEAPLLSIRVDGEMEDPSAMYFSAQNGIITLIYNNGTEAKVETEIKAGHVNFELISIEPREKVGLVVWGPYPTTIKETIGETVGVVRNSDFAIGIQSLNVKTLGGYPNVENDVMPSYNIFAGSDYRDIDSSKRDKKLFRGDTAKPAEFGSVLQAYCRDRSKDRIIPNWKHEKYFAPAYHDGGVAGSKIALFGCPADKALEIIGKIEIEEGLPHPVIDGGWGKTAPTSTAAYLILDFGEDDIEKALRYTEKAGLKYLYHPGPFETWGHFKLRPGKFPDGIESMRRCVEKAHTKGILLGVHTLSNFITTNDPYVTPAPDKRLARVGASIITGDIDERQTEIEIEDPAFFRQMENNNLKTVVIGDELIRYGEVSEEKPYKLLNCMRGAFGTKATAHKAGEEIGKLMDHGYKVFLTNAELQDEIAVNIADLFNKTGLRQISFDGLEGCWSSGMGQYARTLFTKKWYDSLSDDLRGKVITDASNPGHFFWHIYTRMNWGEPWYAGFRESQTQYRLKNQDYFRRNLMPCMLGWFRMTGETSIEDIEWLLARSAGFDAGFALFTGYSAFEENGMSAHILEAIKQWEKARLSGAFNDEQKKKMEDVNREFHLETAGENEWKLYPVHVSRFTHEKKVRQPGEPVSSAFKFENPAGKRELNFIITAAGGKISDISMEIDNHSSIKLPVSLNISDVLKYDGGNECVIYDKRWNIKKKLRMEQSNLTAANGELTLIFDCVFSNDEKPAAKIELRIVDEPEKVRGG